MDSIFKQMLRNEMEFQDIKVKELALRTGISQRTLEGYIGVRGSIPPADVAVKIAKALNVSVEYLVTGESLNKTNKKNVNNMFEVFSSDKKILLKDIIDILEKFEIKKSCCNTFCITLPILVSVVVNNTAMIESSNAGSVNAPITLSLLPPKPPNELPASSAVSAIKNRQSANKYITKMISPLKPSGAGT